jgi:circadian clock protein KaiC
MYSSTAPSRSPLPKVRTGIRGLDELTEGGLPAGRPTLLCGAAGCGKTLMAMEFLVHGATECGEPGVFMAFEETAAELAANVASLGFDLEALIAQKKLAVDFVYLERAEIEVTGEYDLEGLFIRLDHAISSVGAARVVIDSVEALFSALPDPTLLRAELRRLFRWLKEKGVTAIITGEGGERTLTRHGIEEYVSDCVIALDHRVTDQLSTRRLRVVKYRGSHHGTNEYPFLIDENGISILPVTSLSLDHKVSDERVSTGIPQLDDMLGGPGYYRGSSILVSGTAGSGKTSVAAHFADAVCRRGERCLYFLFEESPDQFLRNMRSIGLDLEHWVACGSLCLKASRPTLQGLETHLTAMNRLVNEFDPATVIADPISSLTSVGDADDVKAMLIRLIDHLKTRGITAMLINLNQATGHLERTDTAISSLIDTWLLLRDIELSGERNRGLYILKSRGMAHSHQIREFRLTDRGVQLADVYVGPAGMLTGSARLAQEAQEEAERLLASLEIERQELALEGRRRALESRIEALRAEFAAEKAMAQSLIAQKEARASRLVADRAAMSESRTVAAPEDKRAGAGTRASGDDGRGGGARGAKRAGNSASTAQPRKGR